MVKQQCWLCGGLFAQWYGSDVSQVARRLHNSRDRRKLSFFAKDDN